MRDPYARAQPVALLVRVRDRLVEPTKLRKGDASPRLSVDEVRLQPGCLAVSGKRGFCPARPEMGVADVEMGGGVVRIDGKRACISGHSGFRISRREQYVADVEMCPGQIRRQAYSLLVALERLVKQPIAFQRVSLLDQRRRSLL